jgi:glucose/arabinose dehydrogenase
MVPRVRLSIVLAALTATLVAAGCIPAVLPVSKTLDAEYVVRAAANPAVLAPTADGRLYYAEKDTGRIRVVVDGVLQDLPVADVPVNFAGDRGLIGLALHPDFATNGRIYAFYSRSDTGVDTADPRAIVDHRVVYFDTDGLIATGGEVFVVSLPAGTEPTRIGGRLLFASDGRLLVALGDLGDEAAAGDDTALNGKMLRYEADGAVPDDNPVADSPIYAYGLRDPGGLAHDTLTTAILFTDRQPDSRTELNRLQAGGHYGWPQVDGLADTDAEQTFAAATLDYQDPLLLTAAGQPRALAGLSVNPSTRYGPTPLNEAFVGDPAMQQVVRMGLDAQRLTVTGEQVFARPLPGIIRDVAFAPAGTLYVATSTDVFKIVPTR